LFINPICIHEIPLSQDHILNTVDLSMQCHLMKLGFGPHLYYNSAQSSKMVLLNGPPLSNFVDRGLGEWEWLGPGSTNFFFIILIPLMVLQNGTFEWHFVTHSRSLCVKRPKTYLPTLTTIIIYHPIICMYMLFKSVTL
jgi:hypothetical protein